MVRNVSDIRFVPFLGKTAARRETQHNITFTSQPELSSKTPNFVVKLPQKYTKIGEEKLYNGLTLHSYKLENGYRVTIVPMKDSPAVVKNYVNVGSMNETDDIKGISHFLEHMAFNGTVGDNGYEKLNWGDSFKKIDNMGGWTNASTSYAVTDYVNSTPMLNDKDIEEQIRIIAAMTENLSLTEDMIEKEKSPVTSEINMILDNPETIAIDQTVRTLFNIKSTADELVGGSTKHIMNLTREKVKDYYDKYYTPDNMNLVITGDVNPDKIIEIVSKEFHSEKKPAGNKYEERLVPIDSTVRKDFISPKATSAEIALGFEGPAFNDTKYQIIVEVLDRYLNTEEAGIKKLLKDYNASSYFETDRISSNPYSPNFNLYYVNCDDEKSETVLKIIFDKFSNMKEPSEECLNSIKEALLMDFKDALERSINVNSLIGKTTLGNNTEYLTQYEKILKTIKPEDIKLAINKYLNVNKAAVTIIHPETDENTIFERYNKAQNLNFRGKYRMPVDTDKVYENTLSNNYREAFYETANDNVSYNIVLNFDIPKNINPAAMMVLNDIFDTGINGIAEKDYNNFNQKNNLSQSVLINEDFLILQGYSGYKNAGLNIQKGIELLYNPKINKEETEKAINNLKESLSRESETSDILYNNYESKHNRYIYSKEDILNKLNALTVDDVKNAYEYIINNSQGCIIMNIPKNSEEFRYACEKQFEQMKKVKPYEYKFGGEYRKPLSAVVLTKPRKVSQADIQEVFKFRVNDDIKEIAAINIMNSILSSSNSIGLFNSLREHEHLAYTVKSDFSRTDDCGYIKLKILTTTDNKDTGEISYDNLEKSINGFNRQIGLLLASKYTDEDFESAKKILKANLLRAETTGEKLSGILKGMSHKEGINYNNEIFNIIDSVKREDIDNAARKIFSEKPVYSIVASDDTLRENADFLENLKN